MLGKFASKLSKIMKNLTQRSKEMDMSAESGILDMKNPKKTTSTGTSSSSTYGYSREFYDDEDWHYWSSAASRYSRDYMNQKEDKTIYEMEFFVYGSLQPGNMNWDRLAEETIKAERVRVPGYIRILWSGFGGFHPNPKLVAQTGTATSWELPKEPPKVIPVVPEDAETAKGWILTLRGTAKFFNMLDSFEGFFIGSKYSGNGSYERRALWINGRWVWSYPMPRDNNSLEKIEEWTDATMNRAWKSRSSYSGSSSNYSSYRSSWSEQDDDWDRYYDDYGYSYKPYSSSSSKKTPALPAAKDELSEYVALLEADEANLGHRNDDDELPEWVLRQRARFDNEFASLSNGFLDSEPFTEREEEELLKGESWQDFIDEHLVKG